MALKDFLTRQGRHLVMRTEDGRIARNPDGTQRRGMEPTRGERAEASVNEETWRRNLKRMTNNGASVHERLFKIAMGEVFVPTGVVKDPITNEESVYKGEPQVPTMETQRQALLNLHEMMHGKSVVETEVTAAEVVAEKQKALEAMSDEELRAVINKAGNQTVDALPYGDDSE